MVNELKCLAAMLVISAKTVNGNQPDFVVQIAIVGAL